MLKQPTIGLFFIFQICLTGLLLAQNVHEAQLWHDKERAIHYQPDGEDFLLVNGNRRFNRALYGTNTAFRVEAGDLPEFALYMPGMGGNLTFGLIAGDQSKWLIDADDIESRYRPGSMIYKIKDKMLGAGSLEITVLALADAEGMIVKTRAHGVAKQVQLLAVYGGASGKTFSRNGDIGADPESSFYLLPEYCQHNDFTIDSNGFTLSYLNRHKEKEYISGLFSAAETLKLTNAHVQDNPKLLWESKADDLPVIASLNKLTNQNEAYFLVGRPIAKKKSGNLAQVFLAAENSRKALAGRIQVKTPDPHINTLGGALAMAADGIWESPTFLHGAVAWRMRLNAWRGAYAADALGWHDRAREHFTSYANSQVLTPKTGKVVADTALHLARHLEEMGTAMFSSGYISRNPNDNTKPHHYDMNLVFFDQMLTHFNYTGDVDFIKEMWPTIKRHLAWEKRNFDSDGDGLYDAYCAIWASDGLQYSGGGVTHTSSYNYRANQLAARLAGLVGENPQPYQQEADKILQALNSHLWLPGKGWYAEFQDFLGAKRLHEMPGLWTIYHAIDAKVPDQFQAYQALRYVDKHIPHIPIKAKGMKEEDYYTISTTNWQPYTWSVNNVALAEVLHTALAYWQGGRSEEAFKLWKGNIIESLFLGASPGGFQQLSFYDAIRGELYRDFADPIGVASRTLVEGLFGIIPDALADTLTVTPGFPTAWNEASLTLPSITFAFERKNNRSNYHIKPNFPKSMNLCLQLPAHTVKVQQVTVNGKEVEWKALHDAVGKPMLSIDAKKSDVYDITVLWDGDRPDQPVYTENIRIGEALTPALKGAKIEATFDPQHVLLPKQEDTHAYHFQKEERDGTFFVQLRQGDFTWWMPIDVAIEEPLKLRVKSSNDRFVSVEVKNEGNRVKGKLRVNRQLNGFDQAVQLAEQETVEVEIPIAFFTSGTNLIYFEGENGRTTKQVYQNWDIGSRNSPRWETMDLSSVFNDRVDRIFQQRYLAPRPVSPTLQLPWQGIGNWCYPLTQANIDDTGLRRLAGSQAEITLPNGIPFSTTGEQNENNIYFTSTWDNYPDSGQIAMNGQASHAYFMMAGSTNPMQSQFDNAEIIVGYADGSSERLALRNPDNWWPIEQDYYHDGYAFHLNLPKPYRVHLKTGNIGRDFEDYEEIKGFTTRAVDGGAATILDMPLDQRKELKSLQLKTIANDVVIGLMAITLKR